MITIALGTTPTILIKFKSVNPTDFVTADLTIKNRSGIVLTRHIDTAVIEETQISWKLTQKETLGFSTASSYTVMCNWLLADGTRGITRKTAMRVIDNHERFELGPDESSDDSDDPDAEIIIQNDPLNAESYVTPQQFGAKGNGVTDDTDAIQQAIDSGKSVYLSAGVYKITNPLVITDKHFWNLHGEDATITYSGTGYALRILNATHCRISIGMITALQGGGVEFYSDSINSWNQYVTLAFEGIRCATDCIHVETADDGWCNENRIHGGRFIAGINGVNVVSRSQHTINGWKFYDCGIEGVTTGFVFDATEAEETAICNMVICNSRYAESFEKVLRTAGLVFDCKWTAPTLVIPSLFDCSEQTTRVEVESPISYYWRLPSNAWHRGCIINGKLMGERPTLTEVT